MLIIPIYAKVSNIKKITNKKAYGLDGGSGCSNLKAMYRKGEGVRQNKIQALKYFGKGCDLRSAHTCKKYSLLNQEVNK